MEATIGFERFVIFFFCLCETGSPVAQASLQPVVQLRISLNFQFSHISLLNARIVGMHLYTYPILGVLGIESSGTCWMRSHPIEMQPKPVLEVPDGMVLTPLAVM